MNQFFSLQMMLRGINLLFFIILFPITSYPLQRGRTHVVKLSNIGISLINKNLEYNHDSQFYFHVAPMQCYTNRHFRYFLRLLSSKAILWTEMEKTEDLIDETARHRRLDYSEIEHPLVLQLGGNNPKLLSQIVQNSNQYQYNEINLNVGCPSIESGGAHFGAALMLQPTLTRDIVTAMKAVTDTPISIKCRINAHDKLSPDGSLPDDSYQSLCNFIQISSSTGAVSHFIIHARSAILTGLSPSKNRSIPPLRYNWIKQLSLDFPKLKFTINGGIRNCNDIEQFLTPIELNDETVMQNEHVGGELYGVMAGRWILQRPLDVAYIDKLNYISHSDNFNNNKKFNFKDKIEVDFEEYLKIVYAIQKYGAYASDQLRKDIYSISDILMPFILILEQLRENYNHLYADIKDNNVNNNNDNNNLSEFNKYNKINRLTNFKLSENEIRSIFNILWECVYHTVGSKYLSQQADYVDIPPFRSLSNILAQVIGKKVSNKMIRNRTEA